MENIGEEEGGQGVGEVRQRGGLDGCGDQTDGMDTEIVILKTVTLNMWYKNLSSWVCVYEGKW